MNRDNRPLFDVERRRWYYADVFAADGCEWLDGDAEAKRFRAREKAAHRKRLHAALIRPVSPLGAGSGAMGRLNILIAVFATKTTHTVPDGGGWVMAFHCSAPPSLWHTFANHLTAQSLP